MSGSPRISNLSTEDLLVEMTFNEDPTANTLRFAAVTAGTEPAGGDWQNGAFANIASRSSSTWTADGLTPTMGADAATITLTAGTYDLWFEYTATAGNVVVRRFGTLIVE